MPPKPPEAPQPLDLSKQSPRVSRLQIHILESVDRRGPRFIGYLCKKTTDLTRTARVAPSCRTPVHPPARARRCRWHLGAEAIASFEGGYCETINEGGASRRRCLRHRCASHGNCRLVGFPGRRRRRADEEADRGLQRRHMPARSRSTPRRWNGARPFYAKVQTSAAVGEGAGHHDLSRQPHSAGGAARACCSEITRRGLDGDGPVARPTLPRRPGTR